MYGEVLNQVMQESVPEEGKEKISLTKRGLRQLEGREEKTGRDKGEEKRRI